MRFAREPMPYGLVSLLRQPSRASPLVFLGATGGWEGFEEMPVRKHEAGTASRQAIRDMRAKRIARMAQAA